MAETQVAATLWRTGRRKVVREIELLVPPSGFSSRSSRTRRSRTMSQQSFGALGVQRPRSHALAAGSITEPSRSSTRPPGRARRPRRAREVADRLGQDARLCAADRRAHGGRGPCPSALVLVPTRELALQVAEEFAVLGRSRRACASASVYGGAPVARPGQARAAAHTSWSRRRAACRISSSGGSSSLDRVRMLVLDEADRMLDMGFKPQVDRIVRRLPRKRQTMLFSATLDGEVGELARAYTNNPSRFEAEAARRRRAGRGRAHASSRSPPTTSSTA